MKRGVAIGSSTVLEGFRLEIHGLNLIYIIMVQINLTEVKHSHVMSSFLTCLPLRVTKAKYMA